MTSIVPDFEDYTGTDDQDNPFVGQGDESNGTGQAENVETETVEPVQTEPKVLGLVADPALGLTRGDLPEGYATVSDFARTVGENGLQHRRDGSVVPSDEMKPQMVQAAMKGAPDDDKFPLYVVEDSLGSHRRAVHVEQGLEWWGRRNERIAQRRKNAAEKAAKAAEREANLAENFAKTLERAGKALQRARVLRSKLLAKAGETDGLDVPELDAVPGVAGTIAFSEPLKVETSADQPQESDTDDGEDSAQE